MSAALEREPGQEAKTEADLKPGNVTYSRWQVAQRYELETWRRRLSFPRFHLLLAMNRLGLRPTPPDDDWNLWWRTAFEDYRMLPSGVDSAIEVGCGPFTNVRVIRETCAIDRLVLNDPLVAAYAGMGRSWVNRIAHAEWVKLDSRPLEDLTFQTRAFDLVVVINVLDHVRDPDACMERASQLVNDGGLIIIGQDLYDPLPGRGGYDPGHPIRLDEARLDSWVERSFRSVYRRTLTRDSGRNPEVHGGTFLFVGRA